MYVDPSSRLIKRLVYHSETPEGRRTSVDIRYDWRDSTQLDPAEFATERFVRDQKGTLVPAPLYAQYRLIDSDR